MLTLLHHWNSQLHLSSHGQTTSYITVFLLAITCGTLMNGISVRIKKSPESSLAPSIT